MSISRFARTDEVVRVDLREFDGSDDWVELRAALSWGDMLAVRRASMPRATAHTGGASAGEMDVQIDVGARQLELLARALVRWSFRASPEDPQPLPVSRDLITRLDARLADWLAERADQLYSGEAGRAGV